jgi:hypothetical protein
MELLMITWTDIFYGIGTFFGWIFQGMKWLGHSPNVIFGICVVGGILYWTMRLTRYNKHAKRNTTLE